MFKSINDFDYWELRELVQNVIPRLSQFEKNTEKIGLVKEKGRKTEYHQFDLIEKKFNKQERLLNTEEVSSFLEISIRAAACPMPFNMDIFDGLKCPYGCKYCFADSFRASLYTAFFDNSKSMGIRHCNPTYYKKNLDKLLSYRGKDPHSINNDICKAIAMEIPMRMGIRFEDFIGLEAKKGVSLEMLRYLKENNYPVMINTKSALPGEDKYLEALSENKAGAAIHFTMLTSDDKMNKMMEPGAPSFKKRIKAAKNLSDAGVRVVARIEPYLIFVNDTPEMLEEYIEEIQNAGIKNITFDTYSYSANNPGIRNSFRQMGIDFDRLFILGCDSQALGSILLDKFMDVFRDEGFSCSTFEQGCAPTNDQTICCEVGDWFDGGFNWGCTVSAARYIVSKKGKPVTWKNFESFVNNKGGFLSTKLKEEVKRLWNLEGNSAYYVNWGAGIEPYGRNSDGLVWHHKKEIDHRLDVLNGLF